MKKIVFVFWLIGIFFAACSPNNVISDAAIGKLFDSAQMKGSFALLENGTDVFTIHNLSRYRDSAYAPLASFYELPALIALDKGIINHKDSSAEALDGDVFYDSLISKLGRTEMIKTIDSLHYGKGVVSANMHQFWKDQSLKITADEQLGLIKKLYFRELFFQKKSQEKYKSMIKREQNAAYQLSYIIGSDTTQAPYATWIVGYVEENQHPYFFVLNTDAQSGEQLKEKNIQLLKNILLQQGFLKGTR
jgi:beta-lactamase class D